MNKKKTREELAEFKNGKYMGGPAEERAEKKKKKRMAAGGVAGAPAAKPMKAARPGMDDMDAVRNPNAAMGGGRGDGLPPGLAKRGPGNLPPGLAKRPALPPGLGGPNPGAPVIGGGSDIEPARKRFKRAKDDMEDMADRRSPRARMMGEQRFAKGGIVRGYGVAIRGRSKGKVC